MRGRQNAARRQFEERIAAAWHVAAFDRAKRLPKLADVLARRADAPRYKTSDQMLAQFSALGAGGISVTITQLMEG